MLNCRQAAAQNEKQAVQHVVERPCKVQDLCFAWLAVLRPAA